MDVGEQGELGPLSVWVARESTGCGSRKAELMVTAAAAAAAAACDEQLWRGSNG